MFDQIQRQGNFHEIRKEYRQQALVSLRKREGIPEPEVIAGQMMYRDENGEPHPWAIGKRKGMEIKVADSYFGGDVVIEPLEVSEDGRPLSAEIADLERDVQGVRESWGVSFGESGEPTPDFRVNDLSEKGVDSAIQEYIKSHE